MQRSAACGPTRDPADQNFGGSTLLGRSGDLVRLDEFEVLRRLGGGGMAEVLLARTRAGRRRLVVIKRLRRHLASQQVFQNMFLDEIQVTARLDHPHLVRLAEPGYSLTDWFLVLEPIPGLSLSKLLRRMADLAQGSGALSPRAAALIAGQIASGLHHAHTMRDESGNPMDIVHRDVSPENIMITVAGRAKLIDFGVSKLTGRAAVTRPGEVKGKIGYVAPEQIRRTGRITPRTDIFTLGVVLWEMLAGKRLFFRKTYADSLKALLEERLKPPSEMRDVPAPLDAIVMRALCPDPEQRFANAGEMADALLGLVGADARAAEHEIAEKIRLVRTRPTDFAAMVNERLSGAPEANSKPTTSDSTTGTRPQLSASSERNPNHRPSHASLASMSQAMRGGLRSSVSHAWLLLALATTLSLALGLRLWLAAPAVPAFNIVSAARTRVPIIEALRWAAPAVPASRAAAASAPATLSPRQPDNSFGPLPPPIKRAHIPRRAHRNHVGLDAVRSSPHSPRRKTRGGD